MFSSQYMHGIYHSFSIWYFLFILGISSYILTILLITLTDSCCQYDLRVHVCFINMQFLKKRYAQKMYLFINRCSHIHERDIWWIIDYFEAILPHFTIFIHCRKPMVSLAEAYWPYSLIIFIFYKLFSINQWGSRTLQYLEV